MLRGPELRRRPRRRIVTSLSIRAKASGGESRGPAAASLALGGYDTVGHNTLFDCHVVWPGEMAGQSQLELRSLTASFVGRRADQLEHAFRGFDPEGAAVLGEPLFDPDDVGARLNL